MSHEIGQRLLSLVNGGHAALGRADPHLHVQCLIFVRVNLLRGRHRVVRLRQPTKREEGEQNRPSRKEWVGGGVGEEESDYLVAKFAVGFEVDSMLNAI